MCITPWMNNDIKKTVLVKLFHGCFSRFLNCTNGTKSRNAPQMRVKGYSQALQQEVHEINYHMLWISPDSIV